MAAPVRGIETLNKAFTFAGERMRKELPLFLKQAARPVERGAEANAAAIGAGRSAVGPGQDWSQMRIGANRHSVYVAPQARSTRIASRKRPRFGLRLLRRAMEPALESQRATVGKNIDALVDRIVRQFNRG